LFPRKGRRQAQESKKRESEWYHRSVWCDTKFGWRPLPQGASPQISQRGHHLGGLQYIPQQSVNWAAARRFQSPPEPLKNVRRVGFQATVHEPPDEASEHATQHINLGSIEIDQVVVHRTRVINRRNGRLDRPMLRLKGERTRNCQLT